MDKFYFFFLKKLLFVDSLLCKLVPKSNLALSLSAVTTDDWSVRLAFECFLPVM